MNGLYRQINAYDKVARKLGYAVGQEVMWWGELIADEFFQRHFMPSAPIIIIIDPKEFPDNPHGNPPYISTSSACDD